MSASNRKPVEGALERLEGKWRRNGEASRQYTSDGEPTNAGAAMLVCADELKAALSAAAPRCNRCAADLCEHDNCTDWTCARACGKCAPWPAPARDGVREAAQSTKEYAEQCARDLLTRLFNEHYGSGEAKWFRHALRRNLEPMLVKELLLFGQFMAAKEQADGQ
jgi:hypothetical protein